MIINGKYYNDDEPWGKSDIPLELAKLLETFRSKHKIIIFNCPNPIILSNNQRGRIE